MKDHNGAVTATAPWVILSCTTSLDGCLDDTTAQRLMLSNEADFDRVDALRASVDAILVGAGTVRADNPRLLVRSPVRRAARVARGESASPLRVVVSGSGRINRDAAVFAAEGAETVVYGDGGGPIGFRDLLADLARRGVRRLMVEGGASVLTRFLAEDLADELQLSVAPFLLGDPDAPRAFGPGRYPQSPRRRMILAEGRAIGDVQFSRYLIARDSGDRAASEGASDNRLLRLAVELSRSCPPVSGAYSVGAVVTDVYGDVISTGYSRELLHGLGDPDKNHAEEVALAKLDPADPRLKSATVYTSLEPCSPRSSRPLSCTDHILAAGIPRVVLALREPPLLTLCDGADRLRAAGVEVVEVPELAEQVRAVNAHLLG
jgi:riboflavin biosynthesis pyrimidine reductase/pyrimidine deaminase RibD-like protein